MTNGATPQQLHTLRDGRWETSDGGVVEERLISIFVNGEEVATVMATPRDQQALALGFLANEGLIAGPESVRQAVDDVKSEDNSKAVDLANNLKDTANSLIETVKGGDVSAAVNNTTASFRRATNPNTPFSNRSSRSRLIYTDATPA